MTQSRRSFLGAAGVSLAAAACGTSRLSSLEQLVGAGRPSRLGREELAESQAELVASYTRLSSSGGLPVEQYLFTDTATVTDNHVIVTVPPLYHRVVTADVTVSGRSAIRKAQDVLAGALSSLERSKLLTFTPAGLGLAVGWGLPYFERHVSASVRQRLLPLDLRASRAAGRTVTALLPAEVFASDTSDENRVVLGADDAVFVMASDSLAHLDEAYQALFSADSPSAAYFSVTSIREGFVDGRHVGSPTRSLTKAMALRYRLPGAAFVPESAELFLGFTSTQSTALAPSVIANLESLKGLTDQWPNGYFRGGTTLHLSHLYEDLEGWYRQNSYAARVAATFTPAIAGTTKPGTQTIPEPDSGAMSERDVRAEYGAYGTVGHSSVMQPVSRLAAATSDNYGNHYPKGTSVLLRADFNTVDHPFAYSSRPAADGMGKGAAAGVHFLAYAPTSDTFDRVRRAMDGQYPDGQSLGGSAVHSGFNIVLRTTHRQNFLVPPLSRRSFPLADIT